MTTRPDWWTPELRELTDLLAEPSIIDVRRLPDGRWLVLDQMMFGRVQITVGTNLATWDRAWAYSDGLAALAEYLKWNGKGEPDQWIRAAPPGPKGYRRRKHSHGHVYVAP